MTLESQILRDLKAGRSSLSAIALRVKASERACQIVLDRLVAERTVVTETIDCRILVYRLRW